MRYLEPVRAQSGPVAATQPGTARLRSRLGQVRASSAPVPAADPAEDELERAMDAPDRPVAPQASQRRGSGVAHPSGELILQCSGRSRGGGASLD